MDIVSRLKQFVATTGLSSTQFADTAGIPRPTLSQILNGRNKKISNELIAKLHENFPNLNITWLLFGEGSIYVSENRAEQTDSYSVQPHQNVGLFDDASDNDSESSATMIEPVSEAHCEDFAEYGNKRYTTHESSTNSARHPETYNQQSSPRPYHSTPASPTHTSDDVKNGYVDTDKSKNVAYIMVFYTDKSYEIFNPSKR